MASSTLLLSTATALPAVADDGEKVLKSISKEGNELESPIPESEHSFTSMMKFYVPLQGADGTVLGDVDYLNVDGDVADTRALGKPLVNVYHQGPCRERRRRRLHRPRQTRRLRRREPR